MPNPLEYTTKNPSNEGLYGGKTFPNEIEELKFLQRLQAEKKDGITWSEAHFNRMNSLQEKNKKNTELSPEMKEEFRLLRKRQFNAGDGPDNPDLTPQESTKLAEFYRITEKK